MQVVSFSGTNFHTHLVLILAIAITPLNSLADELSKIGGPFASNPGWLGLLHYKPDGRNGAYRSSAVGQDFFLAEDGPTNPLSELTNTLELLAESSTAAFHFACSYPARSKWVLEKFSTGKWIDFSLCTELQRWKDEINTRGATLVFASSYTGSPSSMFGHALLRLEGTRTPLLSYAVNFAAPVPSADGLSYPIKGLTGQYLGRFSVMPYYQKIREYQHMEKRDIWEYSLSLSDTELERLTDHIWELKDVGFPYYFLDENCGSMMLELLSILRPDLTRGQPPGLAVIPQETLRKLTDSPSLVAGVHEVSRRGELIPATGSSKSPPHDGHASGSVDLSRGRMLSAGKQREITEIAVRGGYHDAMDPIEGYPRGAEIRFLRASLHASDGSTTLRSLDFFQIQSTQANAGGELTNAWRGGLSLSREHVPDSLKNDSLSLQGHYGAGYSKGIGPYVTYGLLDLQVAGSTHFFNAGVGPRLGFSYNGKSGSSVAGTASRVGFMNGSGSVTEIELLLGKKISKDITFIARAVQRTGSAFESSRTFSAGLRLYF